MQSTNLLSFPYRRSYLFKIRDALFIVFQNMASRTIMLLEKFFVLAATRHSLLVESVLWQSPPDVITADIELRLKCW